jgi:HK97 family phage portal protein
MAQPNLWQRIKAVFDPREYLRASIRVMEGAGYLGGKARPFDPRVSVEQFGSWVYIAAMLNAQAVAAVPLKLYVRQRIGRKLYRTRPVSSYQKRYLAGDLETERPSSATMQKVADCGGDFEEVTEQHPLLEVLSQVNPYANGFDLTVLRMLYLQITGNAYVHPVTDLVSRRPAELWVMPSQWMTIVPSREHFVDGYVYGQQSTDQIRFAPDEVIHWKLPNLKDLHYGMSRIEAVWTALMLHNSKREVDQAHFDNQARPDWMFIAKKGASPEVLDRFEERINERLRGHRKAGKFLAISGDLTPQQMSFPPTDLGDPNRLIEEVAGAFGVPISKLLANDPNRANAETGDAGWQRDTILPFCRLDEEKLNEQLVPLFGIEDDAFIAYDNPVPKDKRFELERRTRLVAAGLMTFDEARSEEGLAAYGGQMGEVPRVNGVPLDKVGQGGIMPSMPAGGWPQPAPIRVNDSAAAVEPSTAASSPGMVAPQLDMNEVAGFIVRELNRTNTRDGRRLVRRIESLLQDKLPDQKNTDVANKEGHIQDEGPGDSSDRSKDKNTSTPAPSSLLVVSDIEHRGCEGEGGGHSLEGVPDSHLMPLNFKGWKQGADPDTPVEDVGDADDDRRPGESQSLVNRLRANLLAAMASVRDRLVQELLAGGTGKMLGKIGGVEPMPVNPELLIDVLNEEMRSDIRSRISRTVRDMLSTGIESGLEQIGIDATFVDFRNPDVIHFIEQTEIRLADSVSATTINSLRPQLAEAMEQGASASDIADLLVDDPSNLFSPERAMMIARTEAARAYVQGELEGWRQSGRVEGRKWLLAPQACEFCRSVAKMYEGAVTPLDQPFLRQGMSLPGVDGGIMKISYGDVFGPPLHPNCRCDLIPIVKES